MSRKSGSLELLDMDPNHFAKDTYRSETKSLNLGKGQDSVSKLIVCCTIYNKAKF